MPDAIGYIKERAHINTDKYLHLPEDIKVDPPMINRAFVDELGRSKEAFSRISFEKWERLQLSHGQCANEISLLRFAEMERCCDMVFYPSTVEHIQNIVKLANKHNVVIIPVGGTTCVSNALLMPKAETRMIVTVDMMRLNKLKWVDKENMIACAEAGIVGEQLEEKLRSFGVICGFEPDSVEFSTLGGWIATRASSMKKNKYGNIEDMIITTTMIGSNVSSTEIHDVGRGQEEADDCA